MAQFPSLIKVMVHWGEQDAFGHLNNVTYFRYAESSRMAYFDQVVRPRMKSDREYQEFCSGATVGPIIKSVNCNYRQPVNYPDTVLMASRVPLESIKSDRFVQAYVAVSLEGECIVADGEAVVVTYDYRKLAKADMPREIHQILASTSQASAKL